MTPPTPPAGPFLLVERELHSEIMALPPERLVLTGSASPGDLLAIMVEGTGRSVTQYRLLQQDPDGDGCLEVTDAGRPVALPAGAWPLLAVNDQNVEAFFRLLTVVPDEVALADRFLSAQQGHQVPLVWQSSGPAEELWLARDPARSAGRGTAA